MKMKLRANKMKWSSIIAAFLFTVPTYAQLSPPNAAGITYGHTHLNVADLPAHKKPMGAIAETGLKYAFITDPNGTYIELTERLDKY